jgi:murein DD-endopeptidase MepM/ murein hydrolase activator NlpD
LLTHCVLLLVVVVVGGFGSLGKPVPAALRGGATGVDALLVRDGGAVGSVTLGRAATIVKPVAVPSSGVVSHSPVAYAVRRDDTVASVADAFRISADDVCGSNSKLVGDLGLRVGEKLTLPPVPGLVVTVASGDTAESLARTYQVGIDTMLDYNYLRRPADIKPGMQLVLPGGKGIRCPAVGGGRQGQPGARPALSGPPGCPIHDAAVTQIFGPSLLEGFHAGFDMAATDRTPIHAVAGGSAVVNQGGSGYGNNVMIKVSAERSDLYAHMSKVLVASGQAVQAGDAIGLEGSTGFSTGPHLHYEVRINGVPTDPAPLIRC